MLSSDLILSLLLCVKVSLKASSDWQNKPCSKPSRRRNWNRRSSKVFCRKLISPLLTDTWIYWRWHSHTNRYNILFFLEQPNFWLEDDADNIDDFGLQEQAKYIYSSKNCVCSCWKREYLRELKEFQNLVHNSSEQWLRKGDFLMIRVNEKNIAYQRTGIVNGIVRAVKLWTVKLYLECATQHFYPLGLWCDQKQTKQISKLELNINTKEFQPQPNAAPIPAVKDLLKD